MSLTDKNFRMKRSTKIAMAFMGTDAHARGEFKRMMINAQLAEEAARRAALKSKDTNTNRTPGKNSHSKEGVALD
jgi:hypothetical protein